MKLSVIIPVYNVEQTLCRCVESVLVQSFRDYEVILVDDGASGRCADICDAFADKDERIHVIHKSNGGLSSARNAGIDIAKGDYMMFIDSDDTIAQDTIARLMDIMSAHCEYDMLEYPVYEHYGEPKKQCLRTFENREYDDMQAYWFGENAYRHTYAWNKIYRRELFDGVRFPEGRYFEDVYTLPKLLNHCRTVATTNAGLYYYHHNSNGITATAGGKELNDLLAAHLQLLGTRYSPMKSTDYYARVLNIQIDVFEKTGQDVLLPEFEAKNNNITFKIALSKIIGIKRLCQLYKLVHKIYRNR